MAGGHDRSKSTPDRSRSKKAFAGSHQRSWLWGHHAVLETLAADRWRILELYVTREVYQSERSLIDECRRKDVLCEVVDGERIEQLVKATDHQGIAARMAAFPLIAFHDLLSELRRAIVAREPEGLGDAQADKHRLDVAGVRASESLAVADLRKLPPLVVICDRIQDAFNFGAILRCCDGVQVSGVVVGEKHQASVTPHVARSSSGAVNHLAIASTQDLVGACQQLADVGFHLVAADANTRQEMWNAKLDGPTALVIGSEAHGIEQGLLRLCQQRVIIPMLGQVQSLNAAVASGILLYEIRRQQFGKLGG